MENSNMETVAKVSRFWKLRYFEKLPLKRQKKCAFRLNIELYKLFIRKCRKVSVSGL